MSTADRVDAPTRARCILIVDDERPIREAVIAALESVSDGFLEAETGAKALALADAESPDLIILDLGLPDIPGEEVCREVRRRSGTPLVVVSARHSEDEKVRLLRRRRRLRDQAVR